MHVWKNNFFELLLFLCLHCFDPLPEVISFLNWVSVTLSFFIGELAPALLATISIADQHIDFVVVHMGNDR